MALEPGEGKRGTIGLPLALGMYELLPLWHAFFRSLGFRVEAVSYTHLVQGGTFYNDAVLRAFEMELGKNVIRPAIAGLMGAYGAALYAMDLKESTITTAEGLKTFVHTAKAATCQGCTNHCRLTINSFVGGKKFISGNQCQKGLGIKVDEEVPNLYAWKRDTLMALEMCIRDRSGAYLRQDHRRRRRPDGKASQGQGDYPLRPVWHSHGGQLYSSLQDR